MDIKEDIQNCDKKFKTILADPPWRFQNSTGKMAPEHKRLSRYPTMNLEDIKSLPVSNLCDKTAHLYLWVPNALLTEGLEVMKSWGFKYKTVAFTWVKENKKSEGYFTGLGYWTRANPEMCLLATKGKPQRLSKAVKQLIISKRQEHSKKPDEIRDRIIQLCGDLPRIELFARQKVKGWDYWGDQV